MPVRSVTESTPLQSVNLPSLVALPISAKSELVKLLEDVNSSTLSLNKKVIAANSTVENLQLYKQTAEKLFFESESLPGQRAREKFQALDDVVFPTLLAAFNNKYSTAVSYSHNPNDITSLVVDDNWHGRQPFIFCAHGHAIYVDVFKDKQLNTSIITIDPTIIYNSHAPCYVIDQHLQEQKIHDSRLSVLHLEANVQKSAVGCKFFSLHFAKVAAKDKALIKHHELNIHKAKTYKKKQHNIMHFDYAEVMLDTRYYKHSNSKGRLEELDDRKQTEIIGKHGNIMQRHQKFRVQKKEHGQLLRFSNSIDHFRRKQIAIGEAYLNTHRSPVV